MTDLIARLYRRFFPPSRPTTDDAMPLPGAVITDYSNSVGRYGPDSPQARAVREKYGDDPNFLRFADGIDRIKRALGGSGIDWEPREEVTR